VISGVDRREALTGPPPRASPDGRFGRGLALLRFCAKLTFARGGQDAAPRLTPLRWRPDCAHFQEKAHDGARLSARPTPTDERVSLDVVTQPQGAESRPERGEELPRPLRANAGRGGAEDPTATAGGSGTDPGDAGKIVDALKASADQEFAIAERLSAKARQAFALAAGFFIVAQTVAFGGFEADKLSSHEKHWILALAIVAVGALGVGVAFALKTDATYASRDLPLERLEDDLNAAYSGDPDVIGRLGGYYLGIVRTRRGANRSRLRWYRLTIAAVLLSLAATVSELILSLVSRI